MVLAASAVAMVPIVYVKEVWIRYDASKGLRHALANTFSTTSEWSPKDPALNKEYSDLLAAEAQAAQKRPSS